ncbi:MAG TPA: EI24 domain-containing protein [Stellaceae bacterium]|nr:EI24 domain-containing protein [Stellaceae bacterium]
MPMVAAILLALSDLFAPPQRRVLLASLLGALALLFVLWLGATVLLQLLTVTGFVWLDRIIGVLGSVGALFLAWLLFPAMSAIVMGFFLDRVARAVEQRHYPRLPPPRRQSIGEILNASLRLGLLAIAINLIALPFYFWPAINLLVYYGLNGYLVAKEYFILIALRRLDVAAANGMWRHYRLRLTLSGIVIAFVLSLPVVNLVAPVWAAALMLHLFEGLRTRPATMGPMSGFGQT